MKFLLLDVYPNKPYRINKDQNGGYGTANNYGFGNSLISKIHKGWPEVYSFKKFFILFSRSTTWDLKKCLPP